MEEQKLGINLQDMRTEILENKEKNLKTQINSEMLLIFLDLAIYGTQNLYVEQMSYTKKQAVSIRKNLKNSRKIVLNNLKNGYFSEVESDMLLGLIDIIIYISNVMTYKDLDTFVIQSRETIKKQIGFV